MCVAVFVLPHTHVNHLPTKYLLTLPNFTERKNASTKDKLEQKQLHFYIAKNVDAKNLLLDSLTASDRNSDVTLLSINNYISKVINTGFIMHKINKVFISKCTTWDFTNFLKCPVLTNALNNLVRQL